MNEMLAELDDVIASKHSTQLEVDLADCVKQCVERIALLETKIVNQVLNEEKR